MSLFMQSLMYVDMMVPNVRHSLFSGYNVNLVWHTVAFPLLLIGVCGDKFTRAHSLATAAVN